MPKFIALLIIGLGFLSMASSNRDRLDESEPVGKLMTRDNEIINIYGDLRIGNTAVGYKNVSGKDKMTTTYNIKWMTYGNRVFLSFPRLKNGKDVQLMEVIGMSDKYKLMQFWYDHNYFLVFDHEDNLIMQEVSVFDRKATGGGTNNNKALQAISPYFKDCKAVMDKLNANFKYMRNLTEGVAVERCEGAPDINEIIKTFHTKSFFGKDSD